MMESACSGVVDDAVVVPFELKANLIVVEARVNDQPARLIFDTGASQTLMDVQAAARVGMRSVERRWARGAGGDVEVSLAAMRSIMVGAASASNLTCIVSDLSGISEKLGGGIDGVLGFDFNSRFRITIDYSERVLTFVPTAHSAMPRAMVEGNRWILGDFGFEIARPDESWIFETDTAYSQIVLNLKKRSGDATVSIQVQDFHGLELDQVRGDIDESLPQRFQELQRISDGPCELAGIRAHRFDFRGRNSDGDVQAHLVAATVAGRLWTFTFTSTPEAHAARAAEFEEMLSSIRLSESGPSRHQAIRSSHPAAGSR